jgi:hypothetical protein
VVPKYCSNTSRAFSDNARLQSHLNRASTLTRQASLMNRCPNRPIQAAQPSSSSLPNCEQTTQQPICDTDAETLELAGLDEGDVRRLESISPSTAQPSRPTVFPGFYGIYWVLGRSWPHDRNSVPFQLDSGGPTPSRVLGEMKNTSPGSLNAATAKLLNKVTVGLVPGGRCVLTEPTGMHMALHVERHNDVLPGSVFSVAHDFASKIGGGYCEVLFDPQVKLLRTRAGDWIPQSILTPFIRLDTADADGVLRLLKPLEHETLVKRVEVWMRNADEAGLIPRQPVSESQRLYTMVHSPADQFT